MNKIIGIYKITSPTNKIYIGSSKNIYNRFKNYSKLNCQYQVKLLNSFKKYGVDKHIFEIIEECEFEQLYIRERYWQEFYNVLSNNGLNLMYVKTCEKPQITSEETRKKLSDKGFARIYDKNIKLGGNFKGQKHSLSAKNKISNAVKNRPIELKIKFSKSSCKKINQFDLNKNLLTTFNSAIEASQITNTCRSSITRCCNKKQKSANNFLWEFF